MLPEVVRLVTFVVIKKVIGTFHPSGGVMKHRHRWKLIVNEVRLNIYWCKTCGTLKYISFIVEGLYIRRAKVRFDRPKQERSG